MSIEIRHILVDVWFQRLDTHVAEDRINNIAEAYADAKVREAKQWINVDDRLPDSDLLVMVYSPPQPGDYPDSIRIEFDFICSDYEGWYNHSEHYEHFLCVAKGGADSPMTGPAEKAPYTHWMPLPEPPCDAC